MRGGISEQTKPPIFCIGKAGIARLVMELELCFSDVFVEVVGRLQFLRFLLGGQFQCFPGDLIHNPVLSQAVSGLECFHGVGGRIVVATGLVHVEPTLNVSYIVAFERRFLRDENLGE